MEEEVLGPKCQGHVKFGAKQSSTLQALPEPLMCRWGDKAGTFSELFLWAWHSARVFWGLIPSGEETPHRLGSDFEPDAASLADGMTCHSPSPHRADLLIPGS